MKKGDFLKIAIICIITFITFFPSLKNDFVNWDDDIYVIQNPDIRSFNAETLSHIFTNEYVGLYVPIPMLSYLFDFSIWELNPFGYHLTNLIIHLFSALILFYFIKTLSKNELLAFFVTLLFAIHPMRVESVVWIAERKDVLYVLFYLLSLFSFTKLITSESFKWKWYVLSLLFFILSFLSKIAAVTIPLYFIVIILFINKNLWKRYIKFILPFFLISLIAGIVSVISFKGHGNVFNLSENYNFFDRVCFISYSFIFYIFKLVDFYPLSPTYFYPAKYGSTIPFIYYASFFALAGLLYLVYRFRKNPVFMFGFLSFTAGIVAFLQLIPNGRVIVADRYSYIAHIGLLFFAGYYLLKYLKNKITVFYGITLGIGIIMAIFTYQYSLKWKNGVSLFTHSIINNGNNDLSYINRGLAYYYGFSEGNKTDYNRALEDFNKAKFINKENPEAWFNSANCYMNLNDINSAESDYKKALSIDKEHYKSWNNLGLVYAYKGNFKTAMEYYQKSISINPKFPDAYTNIGFVYLNQNDGKNACEYFQKAAKLGSASAISYLNQYCKN